MSLFGRIITVVVISTWVFPIYFFAHDMMFAWDFQFTRGVSCGMLLILFLLLIAGRLSRRSAKPTSEQMEPDSEPWHSSRRYRR